MDEKGLLWNRASASSPWALPTCPARWSSTGTDWGCPLLTRTRRVHRLLQVPGHMAGPIPTGGPGGRRRRPHGWQRLLRRHPGPQRFYAGGGGRPAGCRGRCRRHPGQAGAGRLLGRLLRLLCRPGGLPVGSRLESLLRDRVTVPAVTIPPSEVAAMWYSQGHHRRPTAHGERPQSCLRPLQAGDEG